MSNKLQVITSGRDDMTTSVITMQFFILKVFTLNEIDSHSNGHMINKILHLWSFHMKFEPRCEKTGFLHVRKQRRRSAAQ